MSTTELSRLTIEHLRGSVVPFSLPFERGKKLSVIYGENGTGKTTICDAFEFMGNGKVSSLENEAWAKLAGIGTRYRRDRRMFLLSWRHVLRIHLNQTLAGR